MLAPHQPYKIYLSHRACRLREFQTEEQQSSVIVIAFPFLYHFSFDSLMQYTPWTSKEKWETTALPKAYNAHESVRNLIIYPGSQVCRHCQYKLMPCWNCWTKCYSEWITAHRMERNTKRRRCRKMWTISNNNPFYNLLKLQDWKKWGGFLLAIYLLKCLFCVLDQLLQSQSSSDTCLCLHIPTANKAKLEYQMHKHLPRAQQCTYPRAHL